MIARLPGVPAVLLLSLCFLASPSGSAEAQTLEDALTAAYQTNPTLLGQRARLRATDEQVPQALANWRPDIALSGDISRSITSNTARTFGGRNQIRTPRGFSLDVTQPLYRGGRTLAATSGAENTVQAERTRLLATEQDVLLAAASAFLDVLRDEAVVKLNVNNEQVLTRQLEATRDRFDVGEITRTDVHQAEARLARAIADRVRAEGDLEASRAAYMTIVGKPAPRGLKAPANVPDLPRGLSDAVAQAVERNPTVVSAEYDKKALQDAVKEVHGELLPSLDLTFSYSKDYENTSNTNVAEEKVIGAELTVPLYQQGAVFSRLREARQNVAESQQSIDRARRAAVEGATRSWETLVAARAQVTALKTAIDANVVALEGVEREAQVGSRTVLDVLDAEQELLDSRVNHIRAQRDELVASFGLLAAVGRMTARDLKLPVTYYDPTEHYREVRDKLFGGTSKGGQD